MKCGACWAVSFPGWQSQTLVNKGPLFIGPAKSEIVVWALEEQIGCDCNRPCYPCPSAFFCKLILRWCKLTQLPLQPVPLELCPWYGCTWINGICMSPAWSSFYMAMEDEDILDCGTFDNLVSELRGAHINQIWLFVLFSALPSGRVYRHKCLEAACVLQQDSCAETGLHMWRAALCVLRGAGECIVWTAAWKWRRTSSGPELAPGRATSCSRTALRVFTSVLPCEYNRAASTPAPGWHAVRATIWHLKR